MTSNRLRDRRVRHAIRSRDPDHTAELSKLVDLVNDSTARADAALDECIAANDAALARIDEKKRLHQIRMMQPENRQDAAGRS